jgi:hypothetical protein
MLGHLVPIERGADGKSDLISPAQRLALASDGLGDFRELGFGGGEQSLTFAGAFGGEQWIAAHDQRLIGIFWGGYFSEAGPPLAVPWRGLRGAE